MSTKQSRNIVAAIAITLVATLLLGLGLQDDSSEAAGTYYEIGDVQQIAIGDGDVISLFVPDNVSVATTTVVAGSNCNGTINVGYFEDVAHTRYTSTFSMSATLTGGSRISITGTNAGGSHSTEFLLDAGSLTATGDIVIRGGDSLVVSGNASFNVSKSLTIGDAPVLVTGLANDARVSGKVTLGASAYVLVYGTSTFVAVDNISNTPITSTAFQIADLGNEATSAQKNAIGKNYAAIYGLTWSTVPIVYQKASDLKDFKLIGWFEDYTLQSRVNPNSLPDIGDFTTLYGQFEARKYLVTFSYNEGVNWIVNGVGQGNSKAVEYNYGIILKVHASVLPGYTGTPVLTVDGKSYSADASHEVVADALFATETRDLVLTFARNDDVTWMFNGINRGTQATVQTAFGSVIDVRVQAAGGYAGTTSIFANGSPYTENNVRVIGDVTFTAKTDSSGSTDDGTQSFKVVLGSKLGYALSAYGGSTSPVPYGGSFSFVIVAHDGYSLSDIAVRVNGNAVVLTNGSYTIRNIVGDQVVEVASVDGPSAQPDKVTVELSSESGISFQYSVNGGTFQDYVLPFDVDKGSTVTIRATGMEEGKLPLWPDGSRSEEYVYVASADLRSPIALTSEDPGDGSSNTVTIIAAAAAIAVIAIVSTLFFRMRRVP